MTPIKRHCQFLVDKEKGKEDGRLRYRIKWNGEIIAFNLGYRVHLSKWSKETQRCVANTTHGRDKVTALEINRAIQEMEDVIELIFNKFEQSDQHPTKTQIREAFNIEYGIAQVTQDDYLKNIFDKFIEIESETNTWTKTTINRLRNVQRHLSEFKADLKINNVTDITLQHFLRDLLKKKKLQNTTAHKIISHTKWFLRWAYRHKYYSGNAHLTFTPKFKGLNTREVIYLTWEELMTLYNKDFKLIPHLGHVRDVFCFCCFTGLRYSDVKKLTKSDVSKDTIEVVTQKTADRLEIDLNNFSKAILKKYKDIPLPDNMALPVISNTKMNVYLKDIGKFMKFDSPIRQVFFNGNVRKEVVKPKYELLTTHCGRRTFVVNALALGIPSEVIMRWTGHSDYESMRPYIKIVDNLKRKEMDKFNTNQGLKGGTKSGTI